MVATCRTRSSRISDAEAKTSHFIRHLKLHKKANPEAKPNRSATDEKVLLVKVFSFHSHSYASLKYPYISIELCLSKN